MEKKILSRLKAKNSAVSNEILNGSKQKTVGSHLIAEMVDCNFSVLNDEKRIKEAMLNASAAAGFTVLDVSVKKFDPQGVTAILLLSESHFSIHTWPELGYAAVDMFTCSKTCDPNEAFRVLVNYLKPKRYSTKEMTRGPNAV